MLKHLDLFSGIGGFSLGLESAGLVETVAFCDFDKYCQQVLNKNFPGVPVYGDVKELNHEKLKADGIDQVDIITGGYPCQPFSVAGRKKGEQDPRHVWPEMFRLIKELRPTWVIGENVGGHIKLGLDSVLENLESEGYSARTFSISASSVGANHKRERVWIVANSGRSVGGKQSPRNSKSIGRWSFETPEWSTDTDQIARSSEGAEIMADSDKMQRQLLRGQQSEQRQETFEGTSNAKWNIRMTFPTPRASSAMAENIENIQRRGKQRGKLEEKVALTAMLPTPTVQDSKNNGGPSQQNRKTKPLNAVAGGTLNPTWVEWLMGYPKGWTDLNV
jgi:DNA-cytosine methyltransferase